jgi:hypothetical protein
MEWWARRPIKPRRGIIHSGIMGKTFVAPEVLFFQQMPV